MTTLAEIRAALDKAATALVSAGPALIRAANQSPNEQARSLNALLEGVADQTYREIGLLLAALPPDGVIVTAESLKTALDALDDHGSFWDHLHPDGDGRAPLLTNAGLAAAILAALAAEGGEK